jgi:hypothetical protein
MTNDDEPDAKAFFVDGRFEQMARRPGGVPREEAIERALAVIEENKPGFCDWLDRELAELGELIRLNEADDSGQTDWTETAYLQCVRMRDVGTTMGFELVTFIANNLCEIFQAVNGGAEYRGDLVDCHMQAMLLARQEQYRNLRPDQLPELSSGLRRVVEYAPNKAPSA